MCITTRAGAGREAAGTSPPEHVALSPAGPDSPVSPGKELTHTVRKQQRALEERLEACLEELRRLCLREAVRAARLQGGAESQGSGSAPPPLSLGGPTAPHGGGAQGTKARPVQRPGPGEQEGQPWMQGGRRWRGPGGHGPRTPAGPCSAQGWACESRLARPRSPLQELTGILPAEFPLKPGEKAPKVRRRIGAAYKLDEWALHREVSLPAPSWVPEVDGPVPRPPPHRSRPLAPGGRGAPPTSHPQGPRKPCLGRNWKGRGLKGGRWASPPKGQRAAAWTG